MISMVLMLIVFAIMFKTKPESRVIVFCFVSTIAGVGRYGLLTWVSTYFTESIGLSTKAEIFSAILLSIGQACAVFVFPFIKTQTPASVMLLVVDVSGMVTGVIWAVAGDMGGRAFTSTIVGVLDWTVYILLCWC